MREWLTRRVGGAPYWLLLLVPIALLGGAAVTVSATAPDVRSARESAPTAPRVGEAPFAAPREPRLLIFGDSYTQGFAAKPRTRGYAYLVGESLGWETDVDGRGGTGFTFGGLDGGKDDFGTRLKSYVEAGDFDPNVIILQGSQNDFRAVGAITRAVVEDVELLRDAYPNARIVLFGPAAPQPLQDALARIDAADQVAADRLDIPYISPYQDKWFTEKNSQKYGFTDGSHLNTAGHAYLAKRFLREFRPLFAR